MIHELTNPVPTENFGALVLNVGDLDGDGIPDIAIGSAGCVLCSLTGSVRVYSGATFQLLHEFRTLSTPLTFERGQGFRAAGDVDADGTPDLVLGVPDETVAVGPFMAGNVYVYSGLTGSLLHEWTGSAAHQRLGTSVDGAGDIDGDGHDDVIVGAVGGAALPNGVVAVYSGRDGTLIYQDQTFLVGREVSGIGDIDLDGFDDFLHSRDDSLQAGGPGVKCAYSGADGSPLYCLSGGDFAEVGDVDADGNEDFVIANDDQALLHSGADGSVLQAFQPPTGETFGFGVAGAGDVNGDGSRDVLFASLQGDVVTRHLYSGRTGQLLYSFPEPPAGFAVHAAAMAGLGDLDGDGLGEVGLAAPIPSPLGGVDGSVHIHAGSKLFLNIVPEVAVAGGTVTHTIREGPPGNPLLLTLVEVNSVAVSLPLLLGTYDSTGSRTLAAVVPPGLPTATLKLRAFALDAGGKLVQSAPEELRIP